MPAARHPLIEILTEPLANHPERRMAAGTLLEQQFDAGHPAVAHAVERLERAGRRGPLIRRITLWCLAGLALAWPAWWAFTTYKVVTDGSGMFHTAPAVRVPMDETARLLLGDPEMEPNERERLLHLSDPDNPAYFAEYAIAHDSLPPDFLETARRIDPDNAFFLYFAASRIGRDAVEKAPAAGPAPEWNYANTHVSLPPDFLQSALGIDPDIAFLLLYLWAEKAPATGPAPERRYAGGVSLRPWPRENEYVIVDEAAYEEALALLEQAAALPRYETHVNHMIAARMGLFEPQSIIELIEAYMHAMGTLSGAMAQRVAADLMMARASQLSNQGNTEEFTKLATQRETLLAHLAANPDVTLIGELVHQVVATGTATNFHAAAERLGLDDQAGVYDQELNGLVARRDKLDVHARHGAVAFQERNASKLVAEMFAMLDRQVLSPPSIDPAAMKPMRMAEHALLGGFGMLAVALALIPGALLIFLIRFAANPVIRMPAKQMTKLIDWRDWGWVAALGIVAPVMFFLGITRLTPLGGLDYSVVHFFPILPGVHHASLLLALLILPVFVMRWRLARRLVPFGVGGRVSLAAIPACAMLLAGPLVALPILLRWQDEEWLASAVFAPLCWCLFFALVLGFLMLAFGRPVRRMANSAAVCAVAPAYPMAIILLCLLVPLARASEKYWLAHDRLLRHVPGVESYETKIAIQLRREIIEARGLE